MKEGGVSLDMRSCLSSMGHALKRCPTVKESLFQLSAGSAAEPLKQELNLR